MDTKVGSIAAGKFADFVVLEKNPYEVPAETLRDIKVWGTVSGGRVFPASEIRERIFAHNIANDERDRRMLGRSRRRTWRGLESREAV